MWHQMVQNKSNLHLSNVLQNVITLQKISNRERHTRFFNPQHHVASFLGRMKADLPM